MTVCRSNLNSGVSKFDIRRNVQQ